MNERTVLVNAQRMIAAEEQAIIGVLAVLEVGGKQALLLRMGADGSVHRLGRGSVEHFDADRFIGTIDPDAFRELSAKITPELLAWCGPPREHPAPRGETCELMLAFQQADGRERATVWRFGSLSQWPPAEIFDFLAAAIDATDAWYEKQKQSLQRNVARAEYQWWPFYSLPTA